MPDQYPNSHEAPLFLREPSPEVKLPSSSGEMVMNHNNTVLYKFSRTPEMSHIYWHDGDEQTYIFLPEGLEDPAFKQLEEMEFPICTAWYPSDKDIEVYLQWQSSRLDAELSPPTE